jgi:hypothetical protein
VGPLLTAVHETTDALVEAMMVLASADRSRLVNVLRQLVAIERGLCEVARQERQRERRGARARDHGAEDVELQRLLTALPAPPS